MRLAVFLLALVFAASGASAASVQWKEVAALSGYGDERYGLPGFWVRIAQQNFTCTSYRVDFELWADPEELDPNNAVRMTATAFFKDKDATPYFDYSLDDPDAEPKLYRQFSFGGFGPIDPYFVDYATATVYGEMSTVPVPAALALGRSAMAPFGLVALRRRRSPALAV